MDRMYKCLVLDVDGTLIDTERAVFSTYQRVFFEEFGRNFTPEELKRAYGVPTEEALTRLGFKDVKAAAEKYHRWLMEAFTQVALFDGVQELLDRLQDKGIVMGIVTSRNKAEVTEDACFSKLAQRFDYIVCADDTVRHKPEAEPLLKIMEKSGCHKDEVLYIGDTHYDYLCAKNAGVDFALALWGAKNTDEIHAKYNLERPEEVLRILEL